MKRKGLAGIMVITLLIFSTHYITSQYPSTGGLLIGVAPYVDTSSLDINYIRDKDRNNIEIDEITLLKGYIAPNKDNFDIPTSDPAPRSDINFKIGMDFPITGMFNIDDICSVDDFSDGGACEYIFFYVKAEARGLRGEYRTVRSFSDLREYTPIKNFSDLLNPKKSWIAQTRNFLALSIILAIIVGVIYLVRKAEKATPKTKIEERKKEIMSKEQFKGRLKERYILGEISRNEYLEMKKELEEDY